MRLDIEKSKRNNRIIISISAVSLEIILSFLLLYIFYVAIVNNVNEYKSNQKLLADSMMKTAVIQVDKYNNDFKKSMISYIENTFPTSSSKYCIFGENNKIVFLKDENTTSTLVDEKINNYFINNISLRDKQLYIVSKSEIKYNNVKYTLLVCTRQNYQLKKVKLYETRLYCLGFFILFGAMLITVIIITFYSLRQEENHNKALNKEIKTNRRIIEKLENDKIKHYVNSEKEFSFYNKSIVSEVIAGLTEEEKKKSVQIDIVISNRKMEHFVFITSVLGRIKGDNSIACYWGENQFKVLLINSKREEALEFIQLFISKYKAESEEKAEELIITAKWLSGGNNEIQSV